MTSQLALDVCKTLLMSSWFKHTHTKWFLMLTFCWWFKKLSNSLSSDYFWCSSTLGILGRYNSGGNHGLSISTRYWSGTSMPVSFFDFLSGLRGPMLLTPFLPKRTQKFNILFQITLIIRPSKLAIWSQACSLCIAKHLYNTGPRNAFLGYIVVPTIPLQ